MPVPRLSNELERYFYEELTHRGLDNVDVDGVKRLVDHARRHKIDGQSRIADTHYRPLSQSNRNLAAFDVLVSPEEVQALKGILNHPELRNFLSDNALQELSGQLAVPQPPIRSYGQGARGAVPAASRRSLEARRLAPNNFARAGTLFTMEVQRLVRDGYLSDPSLSREEIGRRTFALFREYADALGRYDEQRYPTLHSDKENLLRAYKALEQAKWYTDGDPDRDGIGSASEVIFGTDPESPQNRFDMAAKSWGGRLDMDGSFDGAAGKVDAWLSRQGRPAGVVEAERRSPLGFVLDEASGNHKVAKQFEEARAIKTSGVDYAKALLSPEEQRRLQAGGRTLDPSFDMKVDALTPDDYFIKLTGDHRLVAYADSDRELRHRLTVGIEDVGGGHWRPLFQDPAGRRVEAKDVSAYVVDGDGEVVGNKRADDTYSMWWWGYCDLNAKQALITKRLGYPAPAREVTLDGVTFSPEEIKQIVGARLTEVYSTDIQAGFRYESDGFDDVVKTRDGRRHVGRIDTAVEFYQPDVPRSGDVMQLSAGRHRLPAGPIKLTGRDGAVTTIPAADVASLERHDREEILAETLHAFLIKNGGVLVTDGASGREVANGMRTIRQLAMYPSTMPEADRPAFVPKTKAEVAALIGSRGPVRDPDRVVFFAGWPEDGSFPTLVYWMELDERGDVINSKVLNNPDFTWSVAGDPDFAEPSRYNKAMPTDLAWRLYVNSIDNPEALSNRLPTNWREYLQNDGAQPSASQPLATRRQPSGVRRVG